MTTFVELGLSAGTLAVIVDQGFEVPTPVQEQTIPALLAGRDVIAQAPTGTGKTAAYGLPIVERLDESRLVPQALVLVPTRELAMQVAEALHGMGQHRQMVTLPIYGGQPYDRQFRALKRGVQVVVATPGRLIDHLERKTLDLRTIGTVVLDEADEMLNMGFVEDIEKILLAVPREHQTALFSATLPARILKLAGQYLKNPQRVSVAAREAVAPRVRQVYYEVPWRDKADALARVLDYEKPDSAIVFVRTKRDADVVAEQLNAAGYIAQAIHGDINQAQRERVLERFRGGHTQLLVGTDVAARGLDIPDVTHIINYDLPTDAESYVHRIGRTGRAGQSGEALTLVTPGERRQLSLIEHGIHRKIQPLRLPTDAQIAERRRTAFRDEVLKILDAGELDPFIEMVTDLASSRDIAEVAAAALKMAAHKVQPPTRHRAAPASTPVAPRLSGPPSPSRRRDAKAEPRRVDSEMTRLFLRVGKKHGVRPADVVGAIANEAGLSGDDIGDIDLYDTFAFVEVPAASALAVEAALNKTQIRGRPPRASIAVPRDGADGKNGHRGRPLGDAKRPDRPHRRLDRPARSSGR
ncbi:MAG TPA: DEAD/DEAH box helicase [Candidatus Dormibacteraeota bacterium]